jgi:ribulose 1,5-bisphosphate synthetase/thiazole synthase
MKKPASRRKFVFSSLMGLIGIKSLYSKSWTTEHEFVPKSRKILMHADVLVVGGGPGGIGAAIAAARGGAKTLLIENYGFFGGVAAWGLGMQINQMRPGGKSRSVIHEMLIAKLKSYGPMAVRINDHQVFSNVEYLKAAVLDLLDEVGCQYLVHTKAVDTLVEGDRVTGVVVATKSGLANIYAQVIIDCTGDADVTHFAGAETMKEIGDLSPQTLLLNLINSKSKKMPDSDFEEIINFDQAGRKYPLIPPTWFMDQVSNCNFSFINHPGTKELGNYDITDPFQFTEAECKSRRQVLQMVQVMRESGDDRLKDLEICGTSPQIGVRESRRVKGEYVLTEEDAMKGVKFDDVVAWRSGYLDIGWVRFSPMKIHHVPYRAILPEKMNGLLTAGRSISASHEAASAGKSMGNCFATGHAAGTAALLAVREKKQPREIAVKKIQDLLRKDLVDLTRGGEEQSEDMEG